MVERNSQKMRRRGRHRLQPEVSRPVKTTKSTLTNPLRLSLVLGAVFFCIGFAACSDVAGTAANKSIKANRVASYMTQSNAESDSEPIDSELSPYYEWWY